MSPPEVGPQRALRWALVAGVLPAVATSILSCAAPRSTLDRRERPPIVLITLADLRADAVGALGGVEGVTPNIDRLIGEAAIGVRAVASSATPDRALDAVLTGIRGRDATLLSSCLAERLRNAGYETMAFVSRRRSVAAGALRGFETWQQLDERSALPVLSDLDSRPVFVWIELPEPSPPYRTGPRLRELLGGVAGLGSLDDLPQRVGGGVLARALESQPSPADQAAWRVLYLFAAARTDQRLGRVLEALRRAPAWSDLVLAAVAVRGEVLGEYSPESLPMLRRAAIEVPMVLRTPGTELRGWRCDGVPTTGQIPATLLDLAGLRPVPAAEPGLAVGCSSAALTSWEGAGRALLSRVSADGGRRAQVIWHRSDREAAREVGGVIGYGWNGPNEEVLADERARQLAELGRDEWRRLTVAAVPPPPLPLGDDWSGGPASAATNR